MRQVGAATFKKPVTTTSVTSGWVAETASRPETNPATLDLITFAAGDLYASPSATQDILDDAYINLDKWLASEIEDSFAAQETTAFVSGDGSGKPKGFLSYTIAAESTATWGQIGYVASGAAADFATTNPTDVLINLIYAPKSQPPCVRIMNGIVCRYLMVR